MAVPQQEESVFGFTLKAQTKVIGWTYLIFLILGFLFIIFSATLISNNVRESIDKSSDDEVTDSYPEHYFAVAMIIISAVMLLYIAFQVFLLVGVYNDRHGFIQAWIGFEFLMIVMNVFFIISSIGGRNKKILEEFLLFCVHVYGFAIVNRYYKSLKQKKAGDVPPPYKI